MSQDHVFDRAAQLARARAIARDPQDYQRRLDALIAIAGEKSASRRAAMIAAWATGAEDAARAGCGRGA